MREKDFYVYIMANKRNGTLYVGVTSDLVKGVYQHKENWVEGFTQKYGSHQLVYYEHHDTTESAIKREKRVKNWRRQWKERKRLRMGSTFMDRSLDPVSSTG